MVPHDIPQSSILRRDDYGNSRERLIYVGDGYSRNTFLARSLYDKGGSPITNGPEVHELRILWEPTGEIYNP
jgi:hypothetical protein